MNLLLGLDAMSRRDEGSQTPLAPAEIRRAEGLAHLFDLLPVQTDTDLVVPDGQIMGGQAEILAEKTGPTLIENSLSMVGG